MKPLRIALLQANFRSSFPEQLAPIARVACPRTKMAPEDYDFNHQRLISLVRKAAGAGAEIAVSPESYVDGWSVAPGTMRTASFSIDSRRAQELCQVAKESRLWLCAGFLEESDEAIYNSALLSSSSGEIVGHYRKTHETKDVLEKMPYQLGDELPVFGSPWGKVGVLICHDRWYPENARTLRLKGAELILNPTAASVFSPHHEYHDIHRCVQRSQAYVNGLFWASCNSANHGGHSVIVAPDGSVMAEGGDEEELVIAELNPDAYSRYDFVANRRSELYA